jgi:hypothetical protein
MPQLQARLTALLGEAGGGLTDSLKVAEKVDPDKIVLPTDWENGIFKGAWTGKGGKTKKRQVEAMSLSKAKTLVNELYVAKTKADAKDKNDKTAPDSMKEFTMQFLYFKVQPHQHTLIRQLVPGLFYVSHLYPPYLASIRLTSRLSACSMALQSWSRADWGAY